MNTPHHLQVGPRLRKQREKIRFSLRELAKRTSLSVTFLSQLERGQTSISIASLERVAEALGVPILYFFTDERGESDVVRANSRVTITLPDSRISYELVTPDLEGKLEVFYATMPAGTRYEARRLNHPTEQVVLVLSGSIDVCVNGTQHSLSPGDSIRFDGDSLSAVACTSDEEAVWVGVITPPVL